MKRLAEAAHAHRWVWIAVTCILLVIVAAYLTRGFRIYSSYRKGGDTVGQMDLRRRWSEQNYVFRGKNPYDVAFAHSEPARAVAPPRQASVTRDSTVDPDLGVPEGVVYPPWSYFSGALFFWPSIRLLPAWYAGLMIASLLFVAVWAFHEGRPFGRHIAFAMMALSLALGSWVGAIFLGNYPTLIIAMLAGTLWLVERRRFFPAALLLAVAMLKPTVAGPFALAFIVTKRYRELTVMLAYLAIATIAVCAWVHTSPFEMISQMFAASRQFVGVGGGPVQYLIAAGADPVVTTKVVGVIALVLGTCGMYLARRSDFLVLFGVAGVVARLWSYHYYYDDNVLLFLLIAMFADALRRRETMPFLLFWACAASIVFPGRATAYLPFGLFQQITWVACATYLVLRNRVARSQLASTAELASADIKG